MASLLGSLHHLSSLDDQVGAPWPHQQRELLQPCIQLLESTRDLRLQREHYPTSQQLMNDCCSISDASALLELMEKWSCDWRVAYREIYLAASGLFVHPNLGTVEVAGAG